MKKEDYKQMEKEGKKGTKMLIILFFIIVTGIIIIKCNYGV